MMNTVRSNALAMLRLLLLIAVVFTMALVTDQITPLKQLTLYLNQHPDPYRSITIGMSIVGWAIMIGVFVFLLIVSSQPMSDEEARDFMSRSIGQPRIRYNVRGWVAGRSFRIVVPFSDIKAAFRSGTWLRDPNWWPILLGLCAMPLIAYGMFGYFFVIGSPLVKLLTGGALLYATARTVWGFWHA